MRLRLLVCLFCLAAALPLAAQDEAERLQRAYERVDSFVARHMDANGTPGLALAVTSRNGLLRVATYGFADLKARRPVTPETLFEIGSISKSFTAIALLQLREEGKFDPQAPVTRYLPWFEIPTQFEPITGHHLLSHAAGLPRDRDDVYFSRYAVYALREQRTGYAPGSKYAYSNIGYQVLGTILTELEKKPHAEILRRRILDRVGMKASDPVITFETHKRLAVGYIPLYDDRPAHASHPLVEAPKFEYFAGDGSVAATPADLAAYLRMLLNRGAAPGGRVLSEESFRLLLQPVAKINDKSHYGYGLITRQEDGHTLIAHSGGMVGFAAQLLGDLEAGVGVVAFVNGPGRPGAVAEFALKAVRAALEGQELPPLPEAGSSGKAEKTAGYAGAYTAPDGNTLTFEAAGTDLLLLYDGEKVVLEPRGEDRFFAPHRDFAFHLIKFGRREKTAAGSSPPSPGDVVEVEYGSDWYAHPRYNGPRQFDVPAAWRGFAGHYRSANPWSSNVRVLLRQGKLWLAEPSGGEEELVELAPGLFQVGAEETPERVRFDSLVDGQALRLNLSGLDFYRTLTP
ncbi:MAG: serine hydrolase domain-containing protein [Candidatus Acidiferrales bacterium]